MAYLQVESLVGSLWTCRVSFKPPTQIIAGGQDQPSAGTRAVPGANWDFTWQSG